MKEELTRWARFLAAIALMYVIAPAIARAQQPTSTRRIPIVKENRQVARIDTVHDSVTVYRTDTLNVFKVDTLRIPDTHYDTVWVGNGGRSCQRWGITWCTVGEGVAAAALGAVFCNNIHALNKCGMRRPDIYNENDNGISVAAKGIRRPGGWYFGLNFTP